MHHLVIPGICFATVFTSTAAANPDDPCLADVNKDSMLTATDFTAWTAAFNAMDPSADQNCNGIVEATDFSAWLNNYNNGCDLQDHDGDGIASIYEDGGGQWVAVYKRGTNASMFDSDSDGLSDSDENRTFVYTSTILTGTDPNMPDTDGDTISDGDEVLGTSAGLDLPALGANPLRRDLFVEADWHKPQASSMLPDDFYKPTLSHLQDLFDMYANAPLLNPDGTSGVTLHFDISNLVVTSHGASITLPDVSTNVQPLHMDANRYGYFFYGLSTDRAFGSVGLAELGGDTFLISYDTSLYSPMAYSFLWGHEIGHCLGLQHGGNNDLARQPNYNSIMNSRFSTVDDGADGLPDGVRLDYSSGDRAMISTDAIDESVDMYGIPLPVGEFFDWNQNGVLDPPYAYALTTSCTNATGHCGSPCPPSCRVFSTTFNGGPCIRPGVYNECCLQFINHTCTQIYLDHDDWGSVQLTPSYFGRGSSPRIITCDEAFQ